VSGLTAVAGADRAGTLLIWNAAPGGVHQYEVYRGESADFAADSAHYLTYVPSQQRVFRDPTSIPGGPTTPRSGAEHRRADGAGLGPGGRDRAGEAVSPSGPAARRGPRETLTAPMAGVECIEAQDVRLAPFGGAFTPRETAS
jgi:hypothetical protein